MDEQQRAAYVFSQAVCAMIEAIGMHAVNMQRQSLGLSMAYDDEAFNQVIEKYGIGHNPVSMILNGNRPA